MHTLILCRHGDSIWNGGQPGTQETFTGWTDVPLSEKGLMEARNTGQELASYCTNGIDALFTSTLTRAVQTAHTCIWAYSDKPLACYPQKYIADYRLNERHYGALQGFIKADVECGKHGHDPALVQKWRRNWFEVPPLLTDDDTRRKQELRLHSNVCVGPHNVPKGESLQIVANTRIRPFLQQVITPIMNQASQSPLPTSPKSSSAIKGGTGLVVAHANSLLALIGILCNDVEHKPLVLKKVGSYENTNWSTIGHTLLSITRRYS